MSGTTDWQTNDFTCRSHLVSLGSVTNTLTVDYHSRSSSILKISAQGYSLNHSSRRHHTSKISPPGKMDWPQHNLPRHSCKPSKEACKRFRNSTPAKESRPPQHAPENSKVRSVHAEARRAVLVPRTRWQTWSCQTFSSVRLKVYSRLDYYRWLNIWNMTGLWLLHLFRWAIK